MGRIERPLGTARAPFSSGVSLRILQGGGGRYGWTEVFLDVYYYEGWIEDWIGHCCGCAVGDTGFWVRVVVFDGILM